MRRRIDIDELFYNLIIQFIKDYRKVNGIDISTTEATRLIFNKIDAVGGLNV